MAFGTLILVEMNFISANICVVMLNKSIHISLLVQGHIGQGKRGETPHPGYCSQLCAPTEEPDD